MDTLINQLNKKVAAYNHVLENTILFRKEWRDAVKQLISGTLQDFLVNSGMKGKLVENNDMENLESISMELGRSSSGIAQNNGTDDLKNFMIKNNGALLYQQLFNGKIMAMVQPPHIEGYGEKKEPHFLEIVTPGEISTSLIYQHVESLLDIITEWEDFDDDSPQKKTAFQPIGFQHTLNPEKAN
ncbi:MAG: hypothetical protein WBC06_15620 [Chitinophagaceae bacterium]